MKAAKSSLWLIGSLSITLTGLSPAQELAPDDASVAGNLGLWLKDATGTFDPETGTWADSSGNGKDAIPVGEVNVAGPITYIAPTAGMIPGGAFLGEDVASVHFDDAADDMLIAADINGDAGLTNLTIFVVYNVDLLGANAGLTRPAGIGSLAAVQFNNGDNFNLASDPSIRKDNGQIGAGTYSSTFPIGTFIRTTRMSATAIDDWFNTDGNLQNVLSVSGASYTTSTDDYFLGDLRGGATLLPVFPAVAAADFDIIQSLVYTTALTDDQVAGINEWLANNLTGGAPSSKPAFTSIELAADNLSAMLTWTSAPNKVYALDIATDLNAGWEEVFDELPSGGVTTSSNVPTFIEPTPPNPLPKRVFFRAREVAQ